MMILDDNNIDIIILGSKINYTSLVVTYGTTLFT